MKVDKDEFLSDVIETLRMVQTSGVDGRAIVYWEDLVGHLQEVFGEGTLTPEPSAEVSGNGLYTKDQMRQFGDWLASRKDVVTGRQIDEYIAGIESVGSADVVERIERALIEAFPEMGTWTDDDENVETAARSMLPIIEAEVERRVRER